MRLFQLKRGDGDVDTIERRLGLISSREGKKYSKDPDGTRLKSCVISYHLEPCFTPGARFPCKT